MAFTSNVTELNKKKQAATTQTKTTTTQAKTTSTQTAARQTTTATQATRPTIDGNGNGTSTLLTSNKFDYENSSIFDDKNNKSAKDAMQTIQRSSFFKGVNDSQHTTKMLRQLNRIQQDCKDRNVTMDADGDGTKTTTSLAQAVADSYDSVLDLYISEQVESMIDKYGANTNHGGYMSDAALEELAMKGIRADSVGDGSNRIYSFSLMDVKDDIKALIEKEVKTDAEKKQIWDAVYSDDTAVMKDSNGKKGSCIFADVLVPDGSAQKSEINLASILDQMGYDCVSKADFTTEQDYMELISKVEANINDGSYHELNKGQQSQTVKDTYGTVKSVRQALNTLWNHDTAGKGGGKFAHGLGDGSDAGISSSSSSHESSAEGATVANEAEEAATETQQQNQEVLYGENGEPIATDKASEKDQAEEDKEEEKLANKPKIERDKIVKFAEKQMEKLLKGSYKDTASEDLTKANKLDISDKIVNLVNEEFGTKMTAEEIYDTIF